MILEILAQHQPGHPGGFYGFPLPLVGIVLATLLVSWLVSSTLKRRFDEYSQIPIRMTGAQVAEAMLRQSGINNVRVICTPGKLTDHYNPMDRTVNLSEPVYHTNSVAAAAVAAHECGHAVQHKQAYKWLTLRSKMVPAVQIASQLLNYIMIAAIFGMFFLGPTTIWIYISLFAVTTAFAIVTLPVEFDASKRALVWLENSGLAASMEHDKAKNALFWAAMTYVVAAIGSLVQLAYFIMIALNRR